MATTQQEPVVTCDLCKQKINTDNPWPQLMMPFAAGERDRMARAIADRHPMPFGNILAIVRQLPPIKYHRFDFCAGCVDGFLPMLDELRKIAYEEQLRVIEGKVIKAAPEPSQPYE